VQYNPGSRARDAHVKCTWNTASDLAGCPSCRQMRVLCQFCLKHEDRNWLHRLLIDWWSTAITWCNIRYQSHPFWPHHLVLYAQCVTGDFTQRRTIIKKSSIWLVSGCGTMADDLMNSIVNCSNRCSRRISCQSTVRSYTFLYYFRTHARTCKLRIQPDYGFQTNALRTVTITPGQKPPS